ncbi:MAG: hypothetical protein AAFV95_26585 [Bacteroidota bacterium]
MTAFSRKLLSGLLLLLPCLAFGTSLPTASLPSFHTTADTGTVPNNYVDFTECPKRTRFCKGKRSWTDGNRYEGEFKYGEPHGWGTFTFQEGTVFIGEFADGLRHGHGQQSFSNGDNYAGDWRFGHMHGKGVYGWYDGSKYVGTFVKGRMEGKGIITLPNGESYDGEWKYGSADGKGEYTKLDGSKHLGNYKVGKRHGTGVITWRTGDVFVGKWKNGHANKKGTFHFNNGDKYFCTWEEGEMNGKGTYLFVNGRQIKGDPLSIEQAIMDDEELKDEIAPNLGLTWYTIGLEHMESEMWEIAKENFETARKFVPASSDLNKLIRQQMQKLEEKMPEGS